MCKMLLQIFKLIQNPPYDNSIIYTYSFSHFFFQILLSGISKWTVRVLFPEVTGLGSPFIIPPLQEVWHFWMLSLLESKKREIYLWCPVPSRLKECQCKSGMYFTQGRNFVAESGGEDARILRRSTQKCFYLAIFFPISTQSCSIEIWPNKKELNLRQKGGGTKHSLSPGGKKASPTKLRPWEQHLCKLSLSRSYYPQLWCQF